MPSNGPHVPSPGEESRDEPHRFGFVSLFGRPNVGKSTLLNALIGEDVAIATRLPQTTRERMRGLWTHDAFQAALVDTPGFHAARSALNEHMVEEALSGLRESDLALLLVEMPQLSAASRDDWAPGEGARAAAESATASPQLPVVLVVTKCDLARDERDLELVLERLAKDYKFSGSVGVSSERGTGLSRLTALVRDHLPPGPPLYEDGQLSDRSMRWHAAEIIRGVVFESLRDELPYSCAVTISRFQEGRQRDRVEAVIHVERRSQKGIVIGAAGKTVRSISMQARARIGGLTGRPCDLYLEVRVTPNWTRDPAQLEQLGYVADAETKAQRGKKSKHGR